MSRDDRYFLGSDIGTTLTKTVLVSSRGDEIAASSAEYEVLHPHPLWAEQWPQVWFDAFIETVQDVLAKAPGRPEDIASIGISGLYGGSGIPVDKQMKPIRPCIIWMDRRAEKEVDWIRENIDVEKLFTITGNGVDTYHGFTKILWIKRNEPDNWKRIFKFLTPHGYLIHRLTSQLVIDQSSAGNIGGVFDLRHRAWSEASCKKLGIPLEMLPERIVESSDVVGDVTVEGARLTGLAVGTPVVAGGIDAAVATLSAGAFDEGDQVAMIGTSMCWGVVHEGASVSPQLVSMPYVAYPREKVYTFGGAATAGALLRWFRDELWPCRMTQTQQRDVSPYKLLDDEAAALPPGSDRLIILPYFMGERSPIWDSRARGTVLGLTLSHTNAHIYRALLEGVAYALRHNMEAGKQIGLQLGKTCILVGGAANSLLWTQILSDVTGYRFIAVGGSEAALGDALLAGVGVGAIDRFEAVRSWLHPGSPVSPRVEAAKIYDELFKIYCDLYAQLRTSMIRLSALAM